MNIVVARFNEDMEWTKQFKNVIIYNKGILLEDYENTINNLENVGREGHSYYKHIYDNYDNLAEYTIFLQGNPFDHSPNVIDIINNYINNIDINVSFEYISTNILDCNLSGSIRDEWSVPIRRVYNQIFDNNTYNLTFKFGCGAQFIVSREQILKRPRDFYLKIVEMLSNECNPMEGYAMERLHSFVFS